MKELIQKLRQTQSLAKEEWISLIENRTPELAEYLFEQAREVREAHYGKDIYIRGLIEFTNYCKNDCFYCGIRRGNQKAGSTGGSDFATSSRTGSANYQIRCRHHNGHIEKQKQQKHI